LDSYIEKEKLKLKSLLNAGLLIGFLVMLIVNLGLGVTVYQLVIHKSRTMTPPTLSKAFTISDATVDESYLEQMGEYFLNLKLNVTPASVHRKYSILLDYVTEEDWPNVQPTLLREAEYIKAENISSRFDVEDVAIALSRLEVRFSGVLQKHVGSRPLDPEPTTYVVSMNYAGEISVRSILQVESTP
jgi:conjugal transfer pilus assembly protein TraE